MPSIKARLELMGAIGLSVEEVWTGLSKMAWPQNLREVTMEQLQERSPRGPEHVHPKRLLAELAEEFDRGILRHA